MLSPENFHVSSRKIDTGDTVVSVNLSFRSDILISRHEYSSSKVQYCERLLMERIWHKVYGDLLKPSYDLEDYALMYMPQTHLFTVQEKVKKLRYIREFDNSFPK